LDYVACFSSFFRLLRKTHISPFSGEGERKMKAQSRARKILSGEVSRDRTRNNVVESRAPIRVVANGDPVCLETRSRVARKHTIVFLIRIGKRDKTIVIERERGERGEDRD